MGKKLFDYVIGNPPYQDETVGEQKSFAPPVYDKFMEEAYKVADRVELIHPARFLFNAGGTPKAWNEKMLADPHFKILFHEVDSGKVFQNTNINGGIVISYRDEKKDYGAIEVYTTFAELNSILRKVKTYGGFKSFSDIIHNRGLYRFSKKIYDTYPDEMKQFSDSRIGASSFQRLPSFFTTERPNDGFEYIQVFGVWQGNRVYRWFRRDYVKAVDNLEKYKVFISKADGAAGQIGAPIPARICGRPAVAEPGVAAVETFVPIGDCDTAFEADSIAKYITTKFARTLLGALKVTQNIAKPTWYEVPLQDFTPFSDIDWSKSIHDIDLQLYRKYGLDEKEIEFIETHVKEMV